MADVTFIGDKGTYTAVVDEDLDRYVAEGYLIEWIPGVYEFTEAGVSYFASRATTSDV